MQQNRMMACNNNNMYNLPSYSFYFMMFRMLLMLHAHHPLFCYMMLPCFWYLHVHPQHYTTKNVFTCTHLAGQQ